VTVNGGTIDITSFGDGIQAEQEFIMNDGDLTIYTYQGSTYTAPNTQQPAQGGWGGWGGFNWFDDSGHDLGLEFSCKAVKTGSSEASIGGKITVNGGNITIDSTDDALHCGDTMDINGGTITVKTADDALHCDKYLNINDGIINITDSYEGLEAMRIHIKGGDVTVYGFDDPINAGEKGAAKTIDVSNDNCLLQIDGGIIHAYVTNNLEGDALDSNGKIVINGGEIYAEGSVDGPDSALDSDGEMIVNGGLVVATGGLGRGELPEKSSKQNSLYWGNSRASYAAGSVVTLTDSSGRQLVSYTSKQSLKCAVISSPDIVMGGSYTMSVNGNKVADFTVTSALMTQGDLGMGGFSW
ncbi:MAG: carbohydrate-binding domain-containing protein, partial [Ruminococcus sp.]|nr:carbohydrate-binding domain-containing protein [Ruminococcus sp.]